MVSKLTEAAVDKGSRMPSHPRIRVNGIICLPYLEHDGEDWRVVPDTWVLPGGLVFTTMALVAKLQVTGGSIEFIINMEKRA